MRLRIFSLVALMCLPVAQADTRCECDFEDWVSDCKASFKRVSKELVIESDTRQCSRVAWYAGEIPQLSIVEDGRETVELEAIAEDVSITLVSCKVCKDNGLSESAATSSGTTDVGLSVEAFDSTTYLAEIAAADLSSNASKSAAPEVTVRRDLSPIRYVEPVYPARMLSRGLDGWVDVEYTISKSGQPLAITVIESSHQGFERSAIRAVAKWAYEVPRNATGEPVDVRHAARVEFFIDY